MNIVNTNVCGYETMNNSYNKASNESGVGVGNGTEQQQQQPGDENAAHKAERIELFIGCDDLIPDGDKPYDVFVAVQKQLSNPSTTTTSPTSTIGSTAAPSKSSSSSFSPSSAVRWQEVARTETICRNCSPRFCESVCVDYTGDLGLKFEVYARKVEETETERLSAHDYRGGARARVSDLLLASGNQLRLLLHDSGSGRSIGTVFVVAEEVDLTNTENESIVDLDICVPVLRRKKEHIDWKNGSNKRNLISQRFELWRRSKHDDEQGHCLWLPIYRSHRIARQRDSVTTISFTSVSLRYRHLCNGDEERLIRFVFFGVPAGYVVDGDNILSSISAASGSPGGVTGAGASVFAAGMGDGGDTGIVTGGHKNASVVIENERLLAFTEVTLRMMCEMDPTQDVIDLTRVDDRTNRPARMGKVSMEKAEPTDYGSYFAMRVEFDKGVNRVCAPSGSGGGTMTKVTGVTGLGVDEDGGGGGMGGASNASGGSGRKSRILKMVNRSKRKGGRDGAYQQEQQARTAQATAMNGLFSTGSLSSSDDEKDDGDVKAVEQRSRNETV